MKTTTLAAWTLLALTLALPAWAGPRAAASRPRAERPQMDRQQRRQAEVDRRQTRQEKRIDHGIAKGYLTPAEAQKLQDQERAIADLEGTLKSDGKLSKDEFKQLHQALNVASVQIWAEKHDTEGKQMPTYRFGKNVFAKDDLTQKLESASLSPAEAKALLNEFRHMVGMKRRLATADLSADERAKLQAAYNDLLNKYFIIK